MKRGELRTRGTLRAVACLACSLMFVGLTGGCVDKSTNITNFFPIPELPGTFPSIPNILPGSRQQGTLSQTTLEGCAVGGIAGFLASQFKDAENPLLYISIGTLVGCTTGELLNQRRQQYAADADFYDAQIAASKENNSSLCKLNEELEFETQRNKEKIRELKRLQSQKTEQKKVAELELERSRANADIAEKNLAMAKKEINAQQAVLKEMRQEPEENSARIKELKKEIASMRQHVDELSKLVDQMNTQRDAIGQFG